MSIEIGAFLIASAAFLLSIYTYWHTTLKKGKPLFVCSRWTAIKMNSDDNSISAAFAVQVSVINKSGVPLEVKDFLLEAKTYNNRIYFYEPLLLIDLTKWIEDINKSDMFSRAQKGQIPLPMMVQSNQSCDFGYPILFLPIDSTKIVNPVSDSQIIIDLYCLTDRSKKYERIATQEFAAHELKSLKNNSFSGVRRTNAIKDRSKLVEKLRKNIYDD